MKAQFRLLAGYFVVATSALIASENPAMLLKVKSLTAEKDHVAVAIEATVIVGDLRISAKEITLDTGKQTLRCAGATITSASGATVKVQELVIAIDARKFFILSADGIMLTPTGEQSDFEFSKTGGLKLRP